MNQTTTYWEDLASQITIPNYAIINGEKVQAISGNTYLNSSPIDGRTLGQIPDCNAEDIDKAVTAARIAFENGCWQSLSPVKRKQTLLKFANLITDHAEELAVLETLDMGKPIADSLTIDVAGAADAITWHAEAIDKLYDEIAPTSNDELGLITREPIGVVGAIVPWNFPIKMACWKLGPALATGNSIILKPSEKSPLTAIRLAELAIEAGIPKGVLNVVTGFGESAGEPIAKHMDVDGLVFTGSTPIGKRLLSIAGKTNMKRTFVECGGKSANIIFADAPNLDVAVSAAAAAIFSNQGEVCTAGSRLLIAREIADDFIQRLIQVAEDYAPSNPLDPKTKMGAIVDAQQHQKIMDYINIGRQEGAELVFGGHEFTNQGYYISPTIFSKVKNNMRIAQEEIFGPVLTCSIFDGAEEAIAIANDSNFGLAAGIWTSNLSLAHNVAKRIRAGSVWVNNYFGGDMTAPFGGYKQSGNGRDKSIHAIEKYTEIKATWISLG